jgi:hypothetical protein
MPDVPSGQTHKLDLENVPETALGIEVAGSLG